MSEPTREPERRRIDLRARLTASIAAASLLIGSALVVVMSWSGIRAEFARQGRTQARQLAVLAREPLAAEDPDRLAALLRPLAAMDGVLEVSLVSGSGRIAASTRPELSGASAPAAYLTDAGSAEIASYAPGTPQAGRDAMLFVAPVGSRSELAETARTRTGRVVLRLSTADLARARRELILFNLTAAGFGIGILSAAAWWLLGLLLRPVAAVHSAIESLGAGESGTRVDPAQLGPLSGVGDAINHLAASYQGIAGRVAGIADRFHSVVERVAQTASEMEEETEEQSRRVAEVSSRLGQVSASLERIGEEVRGVSEDTEHVSSAVFELGRGLEQTARSMGAVDEAIDASSSSSQQMSVSIRAIASHAEQVRQAAADTAELMNLIYATSQQMDERAQQASDLVAQVNRSTEEGAEAVATTIRGSQEAQSRVLEAKQALHDLADRLGQIGEVMGVLEAINEETNLLALNAAIIAAQAGEHGRAFAVVAGQVRALAGRTAASMQEVEGLVAQVREDSASAKAAMDAGIASVQSGVERSMRAGDALGRIRDAAREAKSRVVEIALSTREQGVSSRRVADAALSTSEMVDQISRAVDEQSRGSEHVLESSHSALSVSRQVRSSTEEQRETGRSIGLRISSINLGMQAILENLSAHAASSRSLAEPVDRVFATARKCSARISELLGSVEGLRAEAEALQLQLAELHKNSQGDSGGIPAK
jgi:methyl-accepting chemotaxis protein